MSSVPSPPRGEAPGGGSHEARGARRRVDRDADGLGRLQPGRTLRRHWPDGGRLHLQGVPPFLCVLRPSDAQPQLRELVASQSSYLVCPPGESRGAAMQRVRPVVEALRRHSPEVLVLEVWEGDVPTSLNLPLEPSFRVVASPAAAPRDLVRTLRRALAKVRLGGVTAEVEQVDDAATLARPETLEPLARELDGVAWIGSEVEPIYRCGDGSFFPAVLAELETGFARALLGTLAAFCGPRQATGAEAVPLGRTFVAEPDWVVDRHLAEVAAAFDFVLAVTPVNLKSAWQQFRRERFERVPELHYRPLTMDPGVSKRTLYNVPIEHVEDPTLVPLLREKQEELDRKITMLADRNTKNFLYESLQLYGAVSDNLHALARKLLYRLPAQPPDEPADGLAGAAQMARAASREIEVYRRLHPRFDAQVEIRGDIAAGLMTSGGRLLISRHHRVRRAELDALLQHEVGTHLLTYFNARAQPFRQLESGLAGFESLQEGLAVLAEYLVGGLTRSRLRVLAGRVIACHCVIGRADLVEAFRLLHHEFGFSKEETFVMVVRAVRGGGFTKDALYLRGLVQLLRYLGGGGTLEPLFIGKLDLRHLPAITDLQGRHILESPPLLPTFLQRPEALQRLERLRRGTTVLQLAKEAMA